MAQDKLRQTERTDKQRTRHTDTHIETDGRRQTEWIDEKRETSSILTGFKVVVESVDGLSWRLASVVHSVELIH